MDRRNRTARASCFLGALLACLLLRAEPSYAHKLKLFATAEGETISGYAYFSGGGRPRNLTVRVLGPSGQKLGETKTNDKGEFTFTARYKCRHLLAVETGDGHGARFVIKADELPEDLPAPGDAASGADREAPAEATAADATGRAVSPAEMEKAIAKALSKQLRPLREQLDRSEEKARLRDILGGIGYILGVAGVAFYFLGVRKVKKSQASARSPEPG